LVFHVKKNRTEDIRGQGTEEKYGHKTKEGKKKTKENYILRSLIIVFLTKSCYVKRRRGGMEGENECMKRFEWGIKP